MKKYMENRKIGRKKTMKKAVHNMNVKKANKVNNVLKLNLDKQQDDIKHSKRKKKLL